MPEKGARPNVHPVQERVLNALSSLSSPLLPDDYLELFNPLWSTRELRGRVQRVEQVTPTATTILIKPGYRWSGHKPGQYVRIGIDIDGVRHWRAYSLTSDPYREDGLISITPKKVETGKVSPYLVTKAKPGTIVSLSNIEGDFVLPDPPPAKLLFISAGSGVTPIMSMLRHLDHYNELNDAVLLHSARHADDVMFGPELRELRARRPGFTLHEQLTREHGRMGPSDLDRLCAEWRERETYISGPNEMLDAFGDQFERAGISDKLHMERFQPKLGLGEAGEGEGGTIKFLISDCETESDGHMPILVAGEDAGLELPFGCREGICHTCVGELRSGRVLTANVAANIIRNIWSYAIIFCGHFPDQTYTFTQEEVENESRGSWYVRQLTGAANIDGGPMFHIWSGNLGYQVEHHLYPDMPSTRYGEIAPKVREICVRYGLPYNSGPFSKQLGMVQRTILRLGFPGGKPRPKPGAYDGPLVRGKGERPREHVDSAA